MSLIPNNKTILKGFSDSIPARMLFDSLKFVDLKVIHSKCNHWEFSSKKFNLRLLSKFIIFKNNFSTYLLLQLLELIWILE